MKPVFKLKAHTGSVLCCEFPTASPDSVISSSEDGSVRVFDLRSKGCVVTLNISSGDAVTSICLKNGDSSQLYCAAGNTVHSFDIRLGSSGRELQKYDHNTDEINQVALNRNATYMAAADDSGEIKIIDLNNNKLYKTLRGVHTNICSAVQFHPQKPWEVISGGLDSKIVKWDISKGRQLKIVDPDILSSNSVGQMCNPPFVHALATHGDSSGEMGRLLAVARGDGAVEVYDLGFQSETPTKVKGLKSGRSTTTNADGERKELALKSGLQCRLSADNGGHLTAVSSVTFARFGERGRYLLSGGNDGLIKLWDWASSNFEGTMAVEGAPLTLSIHHGKKINWLSTIDNNRVNIAVADTSKVLSLYHVL
ncbi:WD repeat-containing protein 53 [Marchantia polymorpha subsp. ruderalis]|uniref:Uncharacterized protein n=2 Tax=Marchantia polymorpha TaxID=3197 RepID=A0AAF6BD55_MARPO|nr:hypothetical protein MARPO_0020s0147 [Marchantia polymorpha]BBN09939.1 hypothetical protein Mp_4g23880 [Marchantia polymorpha subsp. ruderalis]|eukprot:PTQ44513.1 hypothetical protein MARPO_0020s0147 [Marchantia polymorpha]